MPRVRSRDVAGTLVLVDPEPGEEIFFHGHPSWLSLAAMLIKGLLACVVAGVIAGIVTRITNGSVQIGWVIVAVAVVFLILIVVAWIRLIQTTYSITNRRLTIETGILSRELHQTRLERVQNVNATQSLIERMLRIGNVDFDTAGESEYDFAFRGVRTPREIVRTVDRALHELGHGANPHTSAGV
jgi:uncharacterized membrane protein YdbT with pleckstrin-like domain